MKLGRRAKIAAGLVVAALVMALVAGLAIVALVLDMTRPDANCVVAQEGLEYRSQNAQPEPDQPWDVSIGDRYGSHAGCVPGDDFLPRD
ncbi:MAG: hypothetical protein R2704_02180 [Microthrixaceae bacterium]